LDCQGQNNYVKVPSVFLGSINRSAPG